MKLEAVVQFFPLCFCFLKLFQELEWDFFCGFISHNENFYSTFCAIFEVIWNDFIWGLETSTYISKIKDSFKNIKLPTFSKVLNWTCRAYKKEQKNNTFIARNQLLAIKMFENFSFVFDVKYWSRCNHPTKITHPKYKYKKETYILLISSIVLFPSLQLQTVIELWA